MSVTVEDLRLLNERFNCFKVEVNMPELIKKFGEDHPEIKQLAKNLGYTLPTKKNIIITEAVKLSLDEVKGARIEVTEVDWLELAKTEVNEQSFIYLFDCFAKLDLMTVLKFAKTNKVNMLLDYVLWTWQNNVEPHSMTLTDITWMFMNDVFACPGAAILPGVSKLDPVDNNKMLVKFGRLTDANFDYLFSGLAEEAPKEMSTSV